MARGRNKGMKLSSNDNGRKTKKKISPLSSDKIEYVDYKDTDLLGKFISDRAKIRTRRVTGNDTQQQRVIARAVKNAREMGLLPYASRVTTRGRGGGRGRDDRGRDDRGRDDRRDSRPEKDSTPKAEEPTAAVEETPAEEVAPDTAVETAAETTEAVEA